VQRRAAAAADRRAAAVVCSSNSGSSARQAPSGKIKVRAGSISIQIQQQRRASSSSRGERRTAAATEISLVQARKSGLTIANIDLQPPSAVFMRSSGGGWLSFRPKHSCRKRSLQDVGNTYARVTDSHLLWLCSRPVSTRCRMTHANFWKGKRKSFGSADPLCSWRRRSSDHKRKMKPKRSG